MSLLATGMQVLRRGAVTAVVSRRAAALRVLRVDDEDLVEPTVTAAEPPGMAGAVLVPWPNRVEGARWWHAGREQRLVVTEPGLGHANHGLLAGTDFDVVAAGPDALRLHAGIDHAPGYPFTLAVTVEHRLRADGVEVRVGVDNRGQEAAPVALGAHPYLRVGTTPAADLAVSLDADHAYGLDRAHIPRTRFAVAGTAWDLRAPRPVPAVPGHATFERAVPGGAGGVPGTAPLVHVLAAPDGRAVELRADPVFRWTQLYVAEGLAADDGPRTAVAVEPMTAPPNALRTGTGLRLLAPGERWWAGFTIRRLPLTPPPAAG